MITPVGAQMWQSPCHPRLQPHHLQTGLVRGHSAEQSQLLNPAAAVQQPQGQFRLIPRASLGSNATRVTTRIQTPRRGVGGQGAPTVGELVRQVASIDPHLLNQNAGRGYSCEVVRRACGLAGGASSNAARGLSHAALPHGVDKPRVEGLGLTTLRLPLQRLLTPFETRLPVCLWMLIGADVQSQPPDRAPRPQ
jgi:hypothetical protein